MNELEQTRSQFASDFDSFFNQRALKSKTVTSIRAEDGKVLETAQALNGELFIRRFYKKEAVDKIEQNSNMPFPTAWREFQNIWTKAGIEIVPSVLIELDNNQNNALYVIVSKYVKKNKIKEATTEAKLKLAHSLGNLIKNKSEYFPSFEVFMEDMFYLDKGKDGEDKILLLDIDPYFDHRLILAASDEGKDIRNAHLIYVLSNFMWDKWCYDHERTEVLRVFVVSTGDLMKSVKPNSDSYTEKAFMNIHAMAQGFDFRDIFGRSVV